MSSIQFNYFADEKGEQFIREELLKKMEKLYCYQGKYSNQSEKVVKDLKDFPLLLNKLCIFALTKNGLQEQIQKTEGGYINLYESPVIEYSPSFIRENNGYVEGRLAYFAGDKFPDFKKDIQALFRKLKKNCWRDKNWQSWIFNTVEDETKVY